MKYFIVIDGATQNIKAFIFDEKGNEVYGEACPVTPYFSVQPGFAEQDAEKYLEITEKVTRSVVENSHVPKDEIAAVAITSHRSTIVPVDKDGKPEKWNKSKATMEITIPQISYTR